MTVASTNTTFNHGTNALFQAWVTEAIAELLTIGITQTADTGQMTNPCTTNPGGGPNTAYGYYVFSFNDSLQGSVPIFFKLEFGNGGNSSIPMMWITVGTGSNGAGTITGTVMTRVACFGGGSINTRLSYISSFCYNTAQGFLGFVFKTGSNISETNNTSTGGFLIYRSVNSSGVPTADSIHMVTNSASASGSSNSGALQLINHNNNTAYLNSGPIPNSNGWVQAPFGTISMVGYGGYQIYPVYQYAGSASVPGYGINNCAGIVAGADIGLHETMTYNILGTSHKYRNVGCPTGTFSGMGFPQLGPTFYALMMLWE